MRESVNFSYDLPEYKRITNTVKPLLSGPLIKRTPSIKRTLSLVPKLTSYISLYNVPLLSGRRHLNKLYLANFYC